MILRRLISAILFASGLCLCADQASADLVAGVNVIAAWRRLPAQYSDVENPERGEVVALNPYKAGSRLRRRLLFDLQYGEQRSYRGLSLRSLVSSYGRAADFDLVILHFENGMRIPLRVDDLGRLDAFIAVEACSNRGKDCSPGFESVERRDVYGAEQDPRPIQFSWNKLVVGKPWYSASRGAQVDGFSPWRHVDSLTGIEFADAEAYDRQFAVGQSGGEVIFQSRCQYCHGARLVGARFGWDFVTPLPLFEKRPPSNLLNHVKYPKAMAQRLGIQMPPQKDVGQDEMQKLWRWMRDVSRRRLRPYAP